MSNEAVEPAVRGDGPSGDGIDEAGEELEPVVQSVRALGKVRAKRGEDCGKCKLRRTRGADLRSRVSESIKGDRRDTAYLYTIRHSCHAIQHLLTRDDIPEPMSRNLVTLAETTHGHDVRPPIWSLEQLMRTSWLSCSLFCVLRTYEVPIRLVNEQDDSLLPGQIGKLLNQSKGVRRPCWIVRRDEHDGFHVCPF